MSFKDLREQLHEYLHALFDKARNLWSQFFDVDVGSEEDAKTAGLKKRLRLLALVGLLVLALYLGGLIGIIANPYRYGGSFGFFHSVRVALTSKAGFTAFIIFLVIFMVIAFYLMLISRKRLNEDERNFMFSSKGSYGTSRFGIPKQYREFLDVVDNAMETDGIIVGKTLDGKKVVAIPRKSPYNRNIAVCGSQGTNKSIAFARNMIIQCAVRNESFVVTDPKSELFEDTVYYLKQEGYNVYQWNLIDHLNSNGWDVLQEIAGENELEYVDVLCGTIIKNTAGAAEAGDFFDKIETVLLKALILYVVREYPEQDRTLGNVYNMILQETAESLDAKFSSLPVEHPAYGPYNLFSKSPTNKGNAILGLGARLSIFQTDSVKKMTGAKEIDIESIAKQKTAVFCIASDSNTTYSMLNALFISMLFIKLMAYADSTPRRKCDIPVHIILDEFPNIGVIDEFKQKEATARSRDIGIDILFQNVPQLQNRYADGVWEELIGGCDFRILLGCNEITTANYFSELSGMASIEVDTERKNLKTIRLTDITPEYAKSSGLGQRALVLPDEILRMDSEELLFYVRGQQPIRLKKFKFFEHPEALNFRQIKTSQIIPGWRDDISEEEKADSTLDALVKKAKNNMDLCVVKDSEQWGKQRTQLINSLNRVKKKYESEGAFPNGHGFDKFDDGYNEEDESFSDIDKEITPPVKDVYFDTENVSDFDPQMAMKSKEDSEAAYCDDLLKKQTKRAMAIDKTTIAPQSFSGNDIDSLDEPPVTLDDPLDGLDEADIPDIYEEVPDEYVFDNEFENGFDSEFDNEFDNEPEFEDSVEKEISEEKSEKKNESNNDLNNESKINKNHGNHRYSSGLDFSLEEFNKNY